MAAEASNLKMSSSQILDQNLIAASEAITKARENGGGLMILTGAGMSVSSGVPVFRAADGTMSPDFLRFLGNYNKARAANGLSEADDWFSFSVPGMFEAATAKEAWHYWRWRILRAMVEPAEDYRLLSRLVDYFGDDKVFVETSNCDQLHVKSGVHEDRILEIHGSLARLQCSKPCCSKFWPTDEAFRQHLQEDPDWVPMCPECNVAALRPNVMIFGDHAFLREELEAQEKRCNAFTEQLDKNWVVLEVGAGVVIPSIRGQGEIKGLKGQGLIRVNPSQAECDETQTTRGEQLQEEGKYWPLPLRSADAISRLCERLDLP